jgi:DNA-binding cell septation regulator SpoVG
MNIQIIELRLLSGDRPLKAFASVQIGGWTIHDWRVVKHDGQRAWISPPQTSWKTPGGGIKYRSLLSIPGELKQRIEIAILSAWEKELHNGKRCKDS